MAKRILPEAAYDFYARDGRDGETGPMRSTIHAARKDAREMRGNLPSYSRCVIEVIWCVNETKVLKLLQRRRARKRKKP